MLARAEAAHLPLQDCSVNAIVTDPPYNVGKDFGNGAKADRREDYHEWLWETWAECGRVCMDGGFLIYTNRIAHIPLGMSPPSPWRFFHLGVWHKPLSLAGCWYSVAPHWEPIFFWVKGKPWRQFRSAYVQSDVFSHNVTTNRFLDHPTIKPLTLIRELVRFACPRGGIVLDPFLGSGTTLAAAQQEGMSGVGFDINPEYLQQSNERVHPKALR